MEQCEFSMEANEPYNGDSSFIESAETNIQHLKEAVKSLDIPDTIIERALELFEELKSHDIGSLEGTELSWFTCLLYIATIEASNCQPYGESDPHLSLIQQPPCVTVSDLLTVTNINMVTFFNLLKAIRGVLPVLEFVERAIAKLERKYLIVCPLFYKFEKIFNEVFLKDDTFPQPEALFSADTEGFEHRKRFCWMLFVHTKGCILQGFQELVLTYHLLMACIDHVMANTPAFQLKAPFDGLKMESTDQAEAGNSHIMLQELCSRFHGGLEEVQDVKKTMLTPLLQTLTEDGTVITLSWLRSAYDVRYKKEADIDEARFLVHAPHLAPANSQQAAAPERSGCSMAPPVTPVRAVMNTVASLKSLLASAEDRPSSILVKYFQNCSNNPEAAIKDRLSEMKNMFCEQFLQFGKSEQETIAQHRFHLAVRLYYRVLESLLKQEEKRLSQQDFSALLHNVTFHKCLLACAVEVVMKTYGSTWQSPLNSPVADDDDQQDLLFPWVLKTFHLHAYDFVKVLESFVKAETKLPKDIVKHLQCVENQIVESLAWVSSSPLFMALSVSEAPPSAAAALFASPPAGSAHLYLSPFPGSAPPAPAPASQQPPPRKSPSLNMFFNKVCRLAHLRLQNMCTLLEIPKDLWQTKIWQCLEYCISHKYDMLKDRHLDQLVMCCIFAVCRVSSDLDVKFKTIINIYKTLPHARREVYKNVWIQSSRYDTIIVFYNHIFMHSLKHYLTDPTRMVAKPAASVANNMSPVPNRNPSLTASPVYSLPGRTNFFISPMKKSAASPASVSVVRVSPAPGTISLPLTPTHMTPRSRQLYSFGDNLGSSEKLRTINESMRAINKRSPSATLGSRAKRLKFDDIDLKSDKFSVDDVIVVRRIQQTAVAAEQQQQPPATEREAGSQENDRLNPKP